MSYSFRPMTDEELDVPDLLDEGQYQFQVVKHTRKTSKAGNPMAELNIKLWDINGKEHHIFDYLVFTDIKLNMRKVSHFCKSVGLEEEYKKGEIPEELSNYSGVLQLGIQDERPKDGGGTWPKKNVVLDYIKGNNAKPVNEKEFKDDELPF